MRVMFDAVDVNDVPAGFDLLAGYVNGHWPSYFAMKDRFPQAVVVSIDVMNRPGSAQVLDIEPGNPQPSSAPGWFDASLAAGVHRPTLYYSAADHGAVKSYMGARKYDAWIAAWGVSHCPVSSDGTCNVVAWQKQDHGQHGENIDISEVFDDTWNPTAPVPTTPVPLEEDMYELVSVANTGVSYLFNGTTLLQVKPDVDDAGNGWKALGELFGLSAADAQRRFKIRYLTQDHFVWKLPRVS